ncbi:MAG: HD domain-containing phosphohydrolase [Deltaproteobacteria bacterium]
MDTTILIVDDSKTDMMLIKNMLYDYNLLMAYDGMEAMDVIDNISNIDLMILDLNMPRMNGFEVLQTMQKRPVSKRIPTLILTNFDEVENEIKGLNLGAVDYIRKPLNMQSVRKRVEVHMNLRRALKSIEEYNQELEEKVYARTRELVLTRDITIHALIGLLEVRNLESRNHTVRTQWMMKMLCEHLKNKPHYAQILQEEYIRILVQTAPLHDIGKVGIPDNILLKPGAFDPEEYEIMKKHTTYGVEALSVGPQMGQAAGFIRTAIEIVATHHEKWNGSGYPEGLKGEDIPLPGRLMALIDVYDALTNKRVYKEAYSHEKSLDIMRDERGKHFDPHLLDAFIEIESEIRQIAGKDLQRLDLEG